jgi:hypothetical protein
MLYSGLPILPVATDIPDLLGDSKQNTQ